jgi:hypothetical protein
VALPPAAVGKPEADFLKCKSGPKWQRRAAVWARTRAACHLTPFALARTSHWRQSVFGIPKQTSIVTSRVPGAAVRMPTQPSRSSQSADERTLLSALQSGSTRHGARTGGPIIAADSDRAGVCVIGDAACDGRGAGA